MPGLKAAIRAFVLAWHLTLACARLGLRLLARPFARRGRTRSRIIGRTLVELFTALGPTYIKLGQILSTRRDLFSEPVIRELERLQDRLPPIPFSVIPALFREEFGAELGDIFSEFEPHPIASASVASVYRGRLHDGRIVAVKVRRPGIESHFKVDLRLLRSLAGLLGHLPPLRYVPLRLAIDEFGACLERQHDFRLEAAANRRLRSAFVWEPRVLVPALVEELCSSSVLTMDFVEGLHGSRRRDDSAREAITAALRALYQMIFVEGFVHCDLHQGNLHLLPGGRAVLIDFGFMAELARPERLKFAEFFYSMATNDGVRCAQIIKETAIFLPPDLAYEPFEKDIVALVGSVSGAKASEFQVAKFVIQLFDIQRRYRIIGATAFTMSIVSLLSFEGIANDVYPDLDFQREVIPFIIRASIRGTGGEPSFVPSVRSARDLVGSPESLTMALP